MKYFSQPILLVPCDIFSSENGYEMGKNVGWDVIFIFFFIKNGFNVTFDAFKESLQHKSYSLETQSKWQVLPLSIKNM